MCQKFLFFFLVTGIFLNSYSQPGNENSDSKKRNYNGPYFGEYLNRVAFPVGGIGAGMICLEGTGAISHVSVRNTPDIFNEPLMFAALCIKQAEKNIAKVIEGPIQEWKYFGRPGAGNGLGGTSLGLPRFQEATFLARFPFGIINLKDDDIPMEVKITGWSPFIPGDADNSSLPVGILEYHFSNTSHSNQEAVFSYHSQNFMHVEIPSEWGGRFIEGEAIKPFQNGFLMWQEGTVENPHHEGGFAIFVDDPDVKVNHYWFRGGWFDALTMTWRHIQAANLVENPPVDGKVPGASLFVPFKLKPGEKKTIRLMMCWYVPKSNLRRGTDLEKSESEAKSCCESTTYIPWYVGRFKSIEEIADYWRQHLYELREKSELFTNTFHGATLPAEVLEAVAANLTILKSPTVLRQTDGRLWCWEGCHDEGGCCHGSCTHVWNYAQAIPHLFPELERSLRQTEFHESQNAAGHQTFRAALPIRPVAHDFHAATDGQLGGIMKVYREWRISGDTDWLKNIWQKVKLSLDYCIKTWDPKRKGVIEEPHHNTYDIEFWGPDGMCTSFYLGALTAFIKMGNALGEDVSAYEELLQKGKQFMESRLFNGEYFHQIIQTTGLASPSPLEVASGQWNINYSPEALKLLEKEGPKYQYGNGCLSDGILGLWIARMCGIDEQIIQPEKVRSHLKSVHKYNLKHDLLSHVNPQRPAFALGKDGGLLLCTWPKGDELSLPFVYSNEVWTGIEYQVASHLMLEGMVKEGLEIVRLCRDRYDGRVRNPFNEYECGHWYARAMSSYGLIQGLTGVRYDAVEKTLYIDSKIGYDFTSFLATETGFGTVGLKNGKPFLDVKMGDIEVKKAIVSGKISNVE